jgi:hypothetical protein
MDVGLLSDMALCPLGASPCTTNILEIRRFLAPQNQISATLHREKEAVPLGSTTSSF